MLRLAITGQSSLAEVTRHCCAKHFELVDNCGPEIADILWICYDTPIDDDDKPDVDWVLAHIRHDLGEAGLAPLVLISSQLPVGTTARLEMEFPAHVFAYSPENIRVASGIQDFENQARVVVGINGDRPLGREQLAELFAPFTRNLIFTDPSTAEMCKHALNVYLGLTIAYANEIGRICRVVGADPDIVTAALRSEPRVSPKAPLKIGAPFGGGHLARDIYLMRELAEREGLACPIISHIKESNEATP